MNSLHSLSIAAEVSIYSTEIHTWIKFFFFLPLRLDSCEILLTSYLLKIPLSPWLEMTPIAASDLVSVCVYTVVQGCAGDSCHVAPV